MSDIEPPSEDDEDDMDEELVTHSPEPPEFVEPDDSMQDDENSQPGKLHPEQSLPHVFKVGASQLCEDTIHWITSQCSMEMISNLFTVSFNS